MIKNPPNLPELFGDRYQITWDEAQHPNASRDSWLAQIPCAKGTIYPWGPGMLAADVDYHYPTAEKLRKIGITCYQDGDGEKTFVFSLVRWDEVVKILRPRRKRRLSAVHKRALFESGTATRIPKVHGCQVRKTRRQGTRKAKADSKVAL